VLGQKIYRQACAFCHDKGAAGAPKTGDTAAWGPRLAQGMDTLYTVALRGKGAMPARGGNPSLSDPDVKAAVDYMVAQSR
jgi:cytochrome c5